MQFVTDAALEQIAELEGLETQERAQAIADSDTVYLYLRRSEGQRKGPVPEDALRKWGEREGLDPDRMTRALAVLRGLGRIAALAD